IFGKALALRKDSRSARRPGNRSRANAYAAGTQMSADSAVASGALAKLMRIAFVTSAFASTYAHHLNENSGSRLGKSHDPAQAHSSSVRSGPRMKAARARNAPTPTARRSAPTDQYHVGLTRRPVPAGSR